MTPVSDNENLHAYFDGELLDKERAALEATLGDDAQATLGELSLLRQAIVTGLEAEAEKVPEARFEQIWDEVERTLVRDARLQEAADTDASVWGRLAAFFKRPLMAPTAVLAGVAAAFAMYVGTGESEIGENTEVAVASNDEPAVEAADDPMPISPPTDRIAAVVQADDQVFNSEAEIERIEFGGKTGRIDRIEGKQGITTVIWITEDDEITDSERSL